MTLLILLVHAAATLFMVGLIWFVQIPCHKALSDQFSIDVHQRLVSSNWIRTLAWTARGILCLLLIMPAIA
jgi:hypothetical protein